MTATAAQWLEAAERLAKAARRPDESEAQAFARVTASGAGAAFLAMHRHPQGRMPAAVRVVYKGQQAETAEAQLHRLAVDAASTSGESYEVAMSRLLATPEGERLWMQARAEGPSVACPD
jgi:preprotein translocase subunit Sss1